MNTQLEIPLADCETQPPQFTEKTLFHVGVSGGKDSAAALLWMLRVSGVPASHIRASFCDTGNEHEWTYQHIAWLSKHLHHVETIKPALGFFELALSKKRFPSTKARFCTEQLKIWTSQDYIQRLKYEGWDVVAVSGVRADESADRARLPEWDFSGNLLCYSWRPLIRWTLADVLGFHEAHGVPLNPLYAIGAQRVGCWPCIMSRKSEIRTIALRFPERIDQIRAAELEFEKRYGRYSSFFPCQTVPERFRSKPYTMPDGKLVMVATIDDVVRWSMTGDGAEGSYLDQPQGEPVSCNSGFCE